jgi:hypothetical protein
MPDWTFHARGGKEHLMKQWSEENDEGIICPHVAWESRANRSHSLWNDYTSKG